MYLFALRLLLCSCVAAGLGLDQLSSAWRVLLQRPLGLQGCQGCGARRIAAEQSLSDSQLTAVRIDFIKKQILDKLRLKEPPKLQIPLPSLPKPLAGGEIFSSNNVVFEKKEVDEFYGKTDQVILLPKEDNVNCGSAIPNLSACKLFELPPELGSEDVHIAELWVYKERTKSEKLDHIFLVSEVPHWSNERSDKSRKILHSRETYTEEGWTKIDMTWAVKEWLDYHELSHTILIECSTCPKEANQMAAFVNGKHAIFLAIQVRSSKKNHRIKRSINCSPGVSECCREELYVSFADIGWDDWILQPQGYHAYFCRGSCTNAPAITVSGSHYNTIIQKLLHRNRQLNRDADFSPCCTATRLSSIQLLYMDGNQTITQKTLPNMVVESCGCM